jgi:muconolactone delta-isomerase
MEHLVTMTTQVPEETPGQTVGSMRAHQAAHSSELAGRGQLLRLWRPPLRPGESRSLGCSASRNLAETQAILKPRPLDAWMAVQTAARTPDQIDHPGLAAS